MKKGLISALALTVTTLFGLSAQAQYVEYAQVPGAAYAPAQDVTYTLAGHSQDAGCVSCGSDKCDGPSACCGTGCSSWVAEFDAMFLRYNKADGVRANSQPNRQVNFDYEFAPRIALSWITANGMGLRARYFDYDHVTIGVNNTDFLSVDAMALDFEVFERISLTDCTMLEWSAGVRYTDYTEIIDRTVAQAATVPGIEDFTGWGLTLGLEVTRSIRSGWLFARGRGAMVVGDGQTSDTNNAGQSPILLNDSNRGMWEIALGWETARVLQNGMLATLGVSYEMQNWVNFSSEFDQGAQANDTEGRSDVGFDGVVFSFAIER